MERKIFYKIKNTDKCWSIIFLDEDDVHTIIRDNKEELEKFLFLNKDCVFIGANNFKEDNVLLASILNSDIDLFPRTLDVTQGIVRNELISFNKMLCSMWPNGKAMPNFYALTSDEVEKELVFDVEVIKDLYSIEERKAFIEWKLDLIRKYHLPKKSYTASFGHLMKDILGLELSCEDAFELGSTFTLDSRLEEEIKRKDDPFLDNLIEDLKHKEDSSITRFLGDCPVRFNTQGIYGSKIDDYMDITGDNVYLYIDFNSFGPSILINNDWLRDNSKHPERYKEIRDLRLKLKSEGKVEQLFYKDILNAGLDDLNRVYTNSGENVGASLANTGIMTMMLLYRNIEKYGIELIECNTDGLIVKCSKTAVEGIKREVKDLEEKLNLSCDVDVVTKIVHFDAKNYIMEFENGKVKHLGVFGLFQDNPLNNTRTYAVEEALRRYYLLGIPVEITLKQFKDNNDIKSFQIIKTQTNRERPKYLKVGDKYVESKSLANRLFAVKESANPLYTKAKGEYAEYQVKKVSTGKGGFFKFFVADRSLPDIEDLDLSYYEKKCYDVIKNHHEPEKKNIGIKHDNVGNGHIFVDIDGTLIKEYTKEREQMMFEEAVNRVMKNPEDLENKYKYFCSVASSLLLQFIGLCKKVSGYGTIENFADFLESKGLFPGESIETYRAFVREFLRQEEIYAGEIETFDDSRGMLEGLQDGGYKIHVYSNWFNIVQNAKLESHDFKRYITSMYTIDNSYAKSSVRGWLDILKRCDVTSSDIAIMVGNGSSDIVPARFGIPSLIRGGSKAKKVEESGIIIDSLGEVFSILEKEKQKRKRIN